MPHIQMRRAAAWPLTTTLTTLATTLTLVAAPAGAETGQVTLSGTLDTGIYRDANQVWQVGPIQRSHVRLDGVEDLGGGISATFALSHRFDSGSGELESAAKPFWYGESTVGLKGPFGAVQVGRRLDALYSLDWEFDPWANYDRVSSPAWDMWHYNYPSDPTGSTGSPEYGRLNNGVFYDSPQVGGVSLHLSGSFERDAVYGGRASGAAVRYARDGVSGVLARQRNSRGDTDTFVGGRVEVGALSLMSAYDVSETGDSTAHAFTLGATYALGRWTLKGGWGRLRLDNATAETMVGLGASYALSKRTSVYADLSHKSYQDRSANLPGIGLTHSF